MDILTFKMWEDAAANSAGGGGIDGIGVGDKGEPGVHMKKKKKKEKEVLKKMGIESKRNVNVDRRQASKVLDWEKRTKLQQDLRTKMWKNLGMKLMRRKK